MSDKDDTNRVKDYAHLVWAALDDRKTIFNMIRERIEDEDLASPPQNVAITAP